MSTIIKEGFVEKFKSGFLSSKWKSVFARLYSDSTLALYNDRGDSRPTENIFIKNVIPYICVGYMTDRMPVRRPSLPPGTAVQRLVGIGLDPRAEKVHWILFPSEQILEEWLNGIMSTLPTPPNPLPNVPPVPVSQSIGFVPPPKYPDQPPPYGQPGQQQQQPPYYQPPAGYGNAQQLPYPSQQTVVIDRTSTPSGGYGGSSGFGTGLAAGMGGAMVGSLLGYGIGSFFAPHGGWGGWGGWGGGGYGGGNGFGGGYIQDNDTYVTNNYYTNNDDSSTPAQNSGDYSTPSQNDNTDYGDSGGGGTWDDGGGFDGGFDGGGGDW
uniref:PH domain-containing protein n=1 Tax=Globodera pallida TaxID=36090 RepID=A0A183C6L6_GLOPA